MLTNNQKLGFTVLGTTVAVFLALAMLPYTKDWQTLVAGIMSLGAATWAAYLLNRQIRQTEELELKRDKRRFIVARATLPLALSQICAFCQANCDQLKQAYLSFGQEVPPPALSTIAVPDNVLTTVQMMLETTPHENVADRLSEILGMLQVIQARISGRIFQTPQVVTEADRDNIGSYIIDCAAIYALTSSLFGYSRSKADFEKPYDMPPLFWTEISTAFLSLDFHSGAFDDIREIVRRNFDLPLNLETF